MSQRRDKFHRGGNRGQSGFTLLEVLVAMTLIGFGLAVAFTAISSTARLDEKMIRQTAAMTLARSKLNEALSNPAFLLAGDQGEDSYAGTDFGYRVQLRQIPILPVEKQHQISAFKQKLERIDIEVFWGPKDAQQSYSLTSYRIAPSDAKSDVKSGAARP